MAEFKRKLIPYAYNTYIFPSFVGGFNNHVGEVSYDVASEPKYV